jgi:hypothetical protein
VNCRIIQANEAFFATCNLDVQSGTVLLKHLEARPPFAIIQYISGIELAGIGLASLTIQRRALEYAEIEDYLDVDG